MERTRPKFGLIAVIALTGIGFWTIDVFLARTENVELEAEARQDAANGERLLAAGNADAAVNELRKAQAIERDSDAYTLDLARALMADAKLNEAQTLLSEVLERSPNNGEANLAEARLMVRRGTLEEAAAYYHRAIYGIWPENADQRRIQVRLELAKLLAARHADQDLLAELLPLDSEAQDDPAIRKQVARLYIVAGSPDRAAADYRELIRDDPKDGSNYEGLGDAELAMGNYRAAQGAFQNAIHHGAAAQARLDLASRVADLDPTPRGLSAPEKFARSTEILRLAVAALDKCSTGEQAKRLDDSANQLLSAKIRGPVTNEMSEDRLSMAQDVWQFRSDTCPASADEESLQLIMEKLSQ